MALVALPRGSPKEAPACSRLARRGIRGAGRLGRVGAVGRVGRVPIRRFVQQPVRCASSAARLYASSSWDRAATPPLLGVASSSQPCHGVCSAATKQATTEGDQRPFKVFVGQPG